MADPLSDDDIAARLNEVPGWEVLDGKLHRELSFADFSEAFGYMTRLALVAEKLNHHPDWSNSWNRVVLDVVNHSAGGLTAADFEFAAKANEIIGA